MEKVIRVDWTNTAKSALKEIYLFHSEYSEKSAYTIVTRIVNSADRIVFSKQFQVDEFNPKYRRIVVGDYKVLYQERNYIIEILDVLFTLQSPEILRSK